MSKQDLITNIIKLIKEKTAMTETGIYACELSDGILFYNSNIDIVFRCKKDDIDKLDEIKVSDLEGIIKELN